MKPETVHYKKFKKDKTLINARGKDDTVVQLPFRRLGRVITMTAPTRNYALQKHQNNLLNFHLFYLNNSNFLSAKLPLFLKKNIHFAGPWNLLPGAAAPIAKPTHFPQQRPKQDVSQQKNVSVAVQFTVLYTKQSDEFTVRRLFSVDDNSGEYTSTMRDLTR
jgi:hypothetical protein